MYIQVFLKDNNFKILKNIFLETKLIFNHKKGVKLSYPENKN